MSRAEQILLLEAWATVAANRLRLSMFAARTIRERPAAARRVAWKSAHRSDQIAMAVRTAARYVPGATCLTQALALQSMLTRHGYASSLHIGVEKGQDRVFGAHAWVRCGDEIMIGGDDIERFAPLLVREERP